jgi:predicted transcriptional regulator
MFRHTMATLMLEGGGWCRKYVNTMPIHHRRKSRRRGVLNPNGPAPTPVVACTQPSTEPRMTASATMTIRLSAELKDKLERLARDTRRSRSFLAAEAVSSFVERELAIIGGVQRGLADVEAGRVVPHDEAMAEVHAAIDEVERTRKA